VNVSELVPCFMTFLLLFSACLITNKGRARMSMAEGNACNERLISININLIKYLEWLCCLFLQLYTIKFMGDDDVLRNGSGLHIKKVVGAEELFPFSHTLSRLRELFLWLPNRTFAGSKFKLPSPRCSRFYRQSHPDLCEQLSLPV
jgi:hypothetical protein